MSYRALILAVLSLFLGGCAVYDYDNDYYGRRYYGDDDYRVHRHYYDPPRTNHYYVEKRYDDRHHDRNYDRRYHDGRRDHYKSDYKRHDRRDYDDRKYHKDRRYYQPRQDNFQERRHDYSPRLQNWGHNKVQPYAAPRDPRQPGYRRSEYRQQYRVQPGYEARPHQNPRYNNRSDWSMQNRR